MFCFHSCKFDIGFPERVVVHGEKLRVRASFLPMVRGARCFSFESLCRGEQVLFLRFQRRRLCAPTDVVLVFVVARGEAWGEHADGVVFHAAGSSAVRHVVCAAVDGLLCTFFFAIEIISIGCLDVRWADVSVVMGRNLACP